MGKAGTPLSLAWRAPTKKWRCRRRRSRPAEQCDTATFDKEEHAREVAILGP